MNSELSDLCVVHGKDGIIRIICNTFQWIWWCKLCREKSKAELSTGVTTQLKYFILGTTLQYEALNENWVSIELDMTLPRHAQSLMRSVRHCDSYVRSLSVPFSEAGTKRHREIPKCYSCAVIYDKQLTDQRNRFHVHFRSWTYC